MSDYNPPSYIEMARLQTDEEAARRRQQQAQQLMQAGYNPVPNANPILSVLASVISTIKGDSMLKDSDAKISDVLAKKFELQNREDQAKAEAEQRRRQEDWDRELQKIEITAQTGAKYREPRNIDPLSPEGMSAQAQLRRMTAGPGPKASLEEQMWEMLSPEQRQQAAQAKFTQTGSAPPGYRPLPDGSLQAIPGGPADPATKNAAGGGLGAEGAAKVSLYENAMRDAQAYQKAVTNPDGSFNDIAANMPANVRLRESALRAKLRAESGASISPEEARAENDRYGPKLFSSDATNAAAAARLIEDLQHQSATIRGGGQAGAAPQGTQHGGPLPGTIQDGYRFKGGNPADPNSWEPVG